MNAVLKLSLIASLLMASAGVGYYHAAYLPERDAQLDHDRVLEMTRLYAEKRAGQERAQAQRRELEQRRAAEKIEAETRYQTCLSSASVTHDAAWTAECKHLAEKAIADHAGCLSQSKLSQGYCDAAYRTRDGSPHCALPVAIATGLDGDLHMARHRCLREREAALQ